MNSICGRIFPMESSEERLALSWLIIEGWVMSTQGLFIRFSFAHGQNFLL